MSCGHTFGAWLKPQFGTLCSTFFEDKINEKFTTSNMTSRFISKKNPVKHCKWLDWAVGILVFQAILSPVSHELMARRRIGRFKRGRYQKFAFSSPESPAAPHHSHWVTVIDDFCFLILCQLHRTCTKLAPNHTPQARRKVRVWERRSRWGMLFIKTDNYIVNS